MNNINIHQALAEMRALAAQAAAQPRPAETAAGADFAGMLKQAVGTVNAQQVQAAGLSDAFARGENIPLTEVMVSVQKARVSFEAVKQVRNNLLEAYREISRMPV